MLALETRKARSLGQLFTKALETSSLGKPFILAQLFGLAL